METLNPAGWAAGRREPDHLARAAGPPEDGQPGDRGGLPGMGQRSRPG